KNDETHPYKQPLRPRCLWRGEPPSYAAELLAYNTTESILIIQDYWLTSKHVRIIWLDSNIPRQE
ncbi:MAG: hypothetical protein U9Q07_15635, partial [Planctomycetota bacterium]|nr:hypothetical protein [Planctomycetota bacterium]